MQNLKRVSANTKALIMGNGGTFVNEVRTEIDEFLRDAKRFDDALWAVVMQAKETLYKVVDAFNEEGKHGNKQVLEVRRAWRKVSGSGKALARGVSGGTRHVQARAKA